MTVIKGALNMNFLKLSFAIATLLVTLCAHAHDRVYIDGETSAVANARKHISDLEIAPPAKRVNRISRPSSAESDLKKSSSDIVPREPTPQPRQIKHKPKVHTIFDHGIDIMGTRDGKPLRKILFQKLIKPGAQYNPRMRTISTSSARNPRKIRFFEKASEYSTIEINAADFNSLVRNATSYCPKGGTFVPEHHKLGKVVGLRIVGKAGENSFLGNLWGAIYKNLPALRTLEVQVSNASKRSVSRFFEAEVQKKLSRTFPNLIFIDFTGIPLHPHYIEHAINLVASGIVPNLRKITLSASGSYNAKDIRKAAKLIEEHALEKDKHSTLPYPVKGAKNKTLFHKQAKKHDLYWLFSKYINTNLKYVFPNFVGFKFVK